MVKWLVETGVSSQQVLCYLVNKWRVINHLLTPVIVLTQPRIQVVFAGVKYMIHFWQGTTPKNQIGLGYNLHQGLVNVPFWVYWTSPYSSHEKDHIPFMVGWCEKWGHQSWPMFTLHSHCIHVTCRFAVCLLHHGIVNESPVFGHTKGPLPAADGVYTTYHYPYIPL